MLFINCNFHKLTPTSIKFYVLITGTDTISCKWSWDIKNDTIYKKHYHFLHDFQAVNLVKWPNDQIYYHKLSSLPSVRYVWILAHAKQTVHRSCWLNKKYLKMHSFLKENGLSDLDFSMQRADLNLWHLTISLFQMMMNMNGSFAPAEKAGMK